MNKSAFNELWEARVQEVATTLQQGSGAGAVLVAIFDGPWMDGNEPSINGIAGMEKADPFRIARDLRNIADILEKYAGNIADRKPFVADEMIRHKPVRD